MSQYKSSYEKWKHFVQLASFILSILFNSSLIILVLLKSPKKMGTYKHLMCFFSTFAIFFSSLDIVLQPHLITHGTCALVLTDLRESFLSSRQLCIVLLSTLCGCFGGLISSIAIHFVFRFFAMERKGRLIYFERCYLTGWLSIPILVTSAWSLLTVLFGSQTTIIDDYMRIYLAESFGLDLDKATYVAALYFPLDSSGNEHFNFFLLPIAIFMACEVSLSLAVTAYFGVKSYYQIEQLIYAGSSQFTENLQRQLYKALVVQTCIPLTLLFTPIGMFIFFPFFHVNIDNLNAFNTFVYAIYPAVEPLPAMFIIDYYRNAILQKFRSILCIDKNRVHQEEAVNPSASTI